MDLLLLFPPFYICVVFLQQLVLGVIVTLALAVAIRAVKWGQLPGYSKALLLYLIVPAHNAALGRDRAPPYPHKQSRR